MGVGKQSARLLWRRLPPLPPPGPLLLLLLLTCSSTSAAAADAAAEQLPRTTVRPSFLCRSPGTRGHEIHLKQPPLSPEVLYDGRTSPLWRSECAKHNPRKAAYLREYETIKDVIMADAKGDSKRKKSLTMIHDFLVASCLSLPPLRTGSARRALPRFQLADAESSLYVVSAFADMRDAPIPVLRVLAVAPFSGRTMWCQVMCEELPTAAMTVQATTKRISVMPSVDHNCVWQQHVYSCHLRTRCRITRAALTSSECGDPLAVFPVTVAGNMSLTPSLQVAQCASTLFDYQDENLGHLVEYMETARYFGMSKIFLYDAYNISRRVADVLDYYEELGFLERIPWRVPSELSILFYFGQVLQYNDCVYRHMDQAHYLAMLDLDDFFMPGLNKSWPQLVDYLSNGGGGGGGEAGKKPASRSACHAFPWFTACRMGERPTPAPDAELSKRYSLDLKLVTYTKSGSMAPEYKQVVQPRGVIVTHIHFLVSSYPGYLWRVVHKDDALGHVYHYRGTNSRCAPKGLYFRLKLCSHVAPLMERVAHVLLERGLIHRPDFLRASAAPVTPPPSRTKANATSHRPKRSSTWKEAQRVDLEEARTRTVPAVERKYEEDKKEGKLDKSRKEEYGGFFIVGIVVLVALVLLRRGTKKLSPRRCLQLAITSPWLLLRAHLAQFLTIYKEVRRERKQRIQRLKQFG